MKKRPFLYIGLASFLSVLVCSLTTPLVGIVAVSAVAMVLMVCSFVRRIPLLPSMTAMVGVAAVLCALLFTARIQYIVRPQLALTGTTATVTMRVERTISTSNGYIVRVEDGELETGLRLCFWAGYRQIAPKCGDILTATITLTAAYDEELESGNTSKASGIFLYAWPTVDSTVVWEDGQADLRWHERMIYALREHIHDTLYRRMSYEGAAFSEGMMLGNCDNISYDTSTAFRVSGVYHLLAVSGSHLVLITAAVYGLLGMCRCSRRSRALLTMAAILLFTALCGFVASVVRAGVSCAIMLCGHLFRRRPDGLNSLGFAALAMLLVDPFCMYDIGWQLSFAATLGLLLFVPVWDLEITRRGAEAMPTIAKAFVPVSTAVGATLCASLATMPLTALHFGGVSSVFLLGNLVCVPLSEALLMGNFLSVLTAWFTPLSEVIFFGCEQLCKWMTVCAVRLAAFPFASLITADWVTWWLFVLLAALVYGYCRDGARGLYRATLVMLAVLLVASGVSFVFRDTVRVTVASSDDIAVTVQTERSHGVIVSASGAALRKASGLLRDEGVASPDWMLWLGKPSKQTVDCSASPVGMEVLLTADAPDLFLTLPDARELIPIDSGMGVYMDATFIERYGDVWRLTIDDTSILLVSYGNIDLAALPPEWRETDLLLVQEMPSGIDSITAEQTIVCCGYNEVEYYRTAFPDALYAIEGDALQFRAGSPLRE